MLQKGEFDAALEAARVWELRVARRLRRLGYWVLPTCEYAPDSGGPRLLPPEGAQGLVIPDLLVWKPGGGCWVEVKYKARAAHYRRGGYWATGIGRRVYEQYRAVQDVTALPVALVLIHDEEGEVRAAMLDELDRTSFSHVYDGDRMGGDGMVFWRYDSIPLWCTVSSLAAEDDATTGQRRT